MDVPDPFYVVRDEILKSLSQAKVEYDAWKQEVVSKSSNIKTIENALRETVRSIDWDLEDLQETVLIVEKNPSKFCISSEELRSRQHFLQEVKSILKNVKDQLYEPSGLLLPNHKDVVFDLLESKVQSTISNGLGSENTPKVPASVRPTVARVNEVPRNGGAGGFTDDLKWRSAHPGTDAAGLAAEAAALVAEQDAELEQLGSSIARLKHASRRIGGELGDQVALLDDFGAEMAHAETRLESALRRAAHLLHADSSRAQWCIIAGLLVALLTIIVLLGVL